MSKESRQTHNRVEQQPSTQTWRSVHTYTPRSHENLLREFSKVSSLHVDVDKIKRENERLTSELKKAMKQLERKQEVVHSLETELRENRITTSEISERPTHDSDDPESNSPVEEGAEILTQHFSEVIRRHHEVLAQKDDQIRELQEALARKCNHQRPAAEQQIWSHDFRNQSSSENRQRHDVYVQYSQTPRREVAIQYSHPTIENERLRRTEAAIQVFRDELDLLKTQLRQSPLSENRYTPCSTRDKVIVKELDRRRNFWVIADFEKMGQDFLRKLALEEKLDKLHWEIETRRVQVMNDRSKDKAEEPMCTYNKELEMLRSTRNNLLKALHQLMNRPAAAEGKPEKTDSEPHVHFKDKVSFTTIQSIYKPSYHSEKYESSKSSMDWPDK